MLYTGPDIDLGESATLVITYEASDAFAETPGKLKIKVEGTSEPGDPIVGDAKANKLSGTDVGEHLSGLAGNDKINGHGGADFVDGGKGNDVLTGEAGADTFIFAKGYAKDTIKDFIITGADRDKIDLSDLNAIDDFNDLKAHFEDHGKNVWIDAGKDILVIEHVEVHDLAKVDFVF